MELDAETPELVRCAACHELYADLPAWPSAPARGCPECGATTWLAACVPIEESAPPEDA